MYLAGLLTGGQVLCLEQNETDNLDNLVDNLVVDNLVVLLVDNLVVVVFLVVVHVRL